MSKKYTIDDLSRLIDHTNLKTDATIDDMKKLCEEAKKYHFKMVAINQVQSKICSKFLEGTDINVGAAIAFPLGQTTIESKVFETKDAIKNGATEIDYVINLSKVKEKNWDYIQDEMKRIVEVCRDSNVVSKVIFENAYLTKDEIVQLSKISKEVKPDFIKTSTGMVEYGAKVEDVKLMKENVGDNVKVKAAGGIRDVETFLAMIENGAERIGCSKGIAIIDELKERFEKKQVDFIEI
ncbi:MAG: deoxyribose-phosphate aldolase [Helcococcus sp.]|nr:deoxyribose-phosphate aldolase [Helcococcus sp.]